MPEQAKQKAEHKLTYPVEVEFLDGTTGTIDFPRMSSEVFFDALEGLDTTKGIFEIKIVNQVIKRMVPGLLCKLGVKSGISLVKKVMEMEKDNFDLGELLEPIPTEPDGKSESQEDSPASLLIT